MSLLQKLSGFAKTFQSALLTHWRGLSNSASGLEDSHYFQWIYLIKLNSAQHPFCKIPFLFVCPGDWEPPVRLTPLTVSAHFDTRRPYSYFVILFRLYFAIVSSALHAIFGCLPGEGDAGGNATHRDTIIAEKHGIHLYRLWPTRGPNRPASVHKHHVSSAGRALCVYFLAIVQIICSDCENTLSHSLFPDTIAEVALQVLSKSWQNYVKLFFFKNACDFRYSSGIRCLRADVAAPSITLE